MSRLNSNQVLGLVLGTFAVAYTVLAFRIPSYSLPRPVDSDTFPKLLGFALLILSVLLYYERPAPAAMSDDKGGAASAGESSQGMRIGLTSIGIIVYALSLNTVGFVLCSWLLSSGLACFYGYRNHFANVALTGLVVNGLYLLMTKVLDVYLPNDPLPY